MLRWEVNRFRGGIGCGYGVWLGLWMRIYRDCLGGKSSPPSFDLISSFFAFSSSEDWVYILLTDKLYRPPIIQTNTFNTAVLVWFTLALSMVVYGRFVYLVIQDITEYLGIACLTVRKKDEKGHWVHPEKSS